jgi:hypothetical protein
VGAATLEAGAALAFFLTGAAALAVFEPLVLETAGAEDLEFVLVALRAGAFSAAERFFRGCGVAALPALVARFLAEEAVEF